MTEQSVPSQHAHTWIGKLVEEFKRLSIIVVYLYIVFLLYVLDESLILGQRHISFAAHGFAIINALVLGKILFIAEDLGFANRFTDKPLVYPILYKAFAFSVLFVASHLVEGVLIGLWHGKSAVDSIPKIGGGTWMGWLVAIAIFFVSLAPFFAFREIGRVIGRDILWDLMFKRRAKAYKLQLVAD